ncbi:SDR family NAD(P)-dependent oxidoreductase, partial [Accumulibacter sp.]|uniref:SDR family NAD(P)-dependent oxidoreductase n=1 Tax=Accumulibacter sp. TaxID=2053492 RepID=UPI002CB4DBF7
MNRKTILVTGAARRVGSAIARALHATGANILVHYHLASEAAAALVAELNLARPSSAACLQADLRQVETS